MNTELSGHFAKNNVVKCALSILLAGLAVCSCSKRASRAGVADSKTFEGAPPAIKEAWDRAQQAAGRHDFSTAIQTLRRLSRQGTTLDQNKTVFDAIVVYEGELREAARKGDLSARQAMKTLGVNPKAP